MISGIGSSPNFSGMQSMRPQNHNPFEKLDANADGGLDSTELATMAKHVSERSGTSVSVEDLLTGLDTDGNGQVSQAEFDAGRPEGPPPGPPKMGEEGEDFMEWLQSAREGVETSAFLDFLA